MSDNWKLTIPTRRTNSVRNPIFGKAGNYSAYGGATATRTAGAGRFGTHGLVMDTATDGGVYVNTAAITGANDTFAVSFLDTTTPVLGDAPTTSTGVQFVDSDLGKAVATDSALTNLVRNPSLETDSTGYASDGTVTLAQSADWAYVGTYSLKRSDYVSGAANFYYVDFVNPLSASTTYTWSAVVRRDGGGVVSATQLRPLASWQTGSTGAVTNALYEDLGGGWWRVSQTFTTTTLGTFWVVGFEVQAGYTSETWYADAWMLTQTDYSPVYFDGSTGTGYAWSGTANASTSTKVASDLEYVTAWPSAGTLKTSFRFCTGSIKLVKQYIFSNNETGSNEISAYLQAVGPNTRLYVKYSSTAYLYGVIPTADDWHSLIVKWSASAISIQMDANTAEVTAHALTPTLGTALMIGANGGDELSGEIDYLYIQNSYTPTDADWAATVWENYAIGGFITAVSDFGDSVIIYDKGTYSSDWIVGSGNGTGPIGALIIRTDDETDHVIAAVQVEELASSTESASTLIYGDLASGHYWTGSPHASPSLRIESAASGGVEYPVQTEYDFCIESDTGAGMVPLSVNIANTPGRAGGALSSIDTKVRGFEWRGALSGSANLAAFHAMRQKLVKAVHSFSDSVFQPRRLAYTGAAVDKTIDAFYVSGLELGATQKVAHEDITIRWDAADPYFYAYGNGQQLGGDFGTIESKGMIVRSNGNWETYQPVTSITGGNTDHAGFTTGVIYDGYIWIGGSFSTINGDARVNLIKFNLETKLFERWDNTAGFSWSANSTVWKIIQLPDRKFLIVGDFTITGVFSPAYMMVFDPDTGTFTNPFGTGANGAVYDACFVQNEGVYMVGDFTTINAVTYENAVLWNSPYGTALSALGDNNPTTSEIRSVVPHPSGTGVYLGGVNTTLWNATVVNGVFYWNNSNATVDALNGGFGSSYDLLLASDGNLYSAQTSQLAYYTGAAWVSIDVAGGGAYSLAEIDGLIMVRGFEGIGPDTTTRYWDGERLLRGILPVALSDGAFPLGDSYQRMKALQYGEETYLLYMRSDTGLTDDIVSPVTSVIAYEGTAPAHLAVQMTISTAGDYRQTLSFIRNERSGEVVYFDQYYTTDGEVITVESSESGLSVTSDLFGDISSFIANSSAGSLRLLPASEGSADNPITIFIGAGDETGANDTTAPVIETVYTWRDTYLSQD